MIKEHRKILLIDTDISFNQQLSGICRTIGYEVISVALAKSAIEELQGDFTIDGIICAVKSTKSTIEFIERIRQLPKFNHIPIILACTSCEASVFQAFIKYGASDVILLPVDDDRLKNRTEYALDHGKPKILIVDDNDLLLGHFEYIVELEGFRALTCQNAAEAIRILAEENIRVLISDIKLPRTTGLELMGFTKDKYPNLPVVLITGYAKEYSAYKAKQAGADGYLTKPFKNVELAGIIRMLLAKSHKQVRSL